MNASSTSHLSGKHPNFEVLDGATRTLPHSIEAEQFLLSCLMLDGAPVMARAKQARVHDGSFYDAKHGIIFAALEALGNHGLRPLPSEANFVLILFGGALTAETAYNGLAERGYIVRWLPGQGLPQALRITIGTARQMDDIAAALREMAEAAK